MVGKEAATQVARFWPHLVQWPVYVFPTPGAARTYLAPIIAQLASPMEAALSVDEQQGQDTLLV